VATLLRASLEPLLLRYNGETLLNHYRFAVLTSYSECRILGSPPQVLLLLRRRHEVYVMTLVTVFNGLVQWLKKCARMAKEEL
jgi:hypothetical protein